MTVGHTTKFDIFRCPTCGSDVSLEDATTGGRCPRCERPFASPGGVIDFVSVGDLSSERVYYDEYYRTRRGGARPPHVDFAALAKIWTGPDAPWEMQRVWERLGNITGKTVLLLGNGESRSELYMLSRNPGALIYSDLSPVGLGSLAGPLLESDRLLFAAMDALDLPIRDESVDVVYGFAFVHHLPELDRFLSEVARVLRPGGRAVFMDNAYSPLWQKIKLGFLRPLMRLSHRREPRSPEDVRDTMDGGMREEVLAEKIRAAGGNPWFERVAFLYWYWKRGTVLFPEVFRFIPRHDLVSRVLKGIDMRLAPFPSIRRNMVRLIWGLEKPQTEVYPAAASQSSAARRLGETRYPEAPDASASR